MESQSTVFSISRAMAQRKETPKMIYPKSALFSECKYRLCGGIIDIVLRKPILRASEINIVSLLLREMTDDGLPNLPKLTLN